MSDRLNLQEFPGSTARISRRWLARASLIALLTAAAPAAIRAAECPKQVIPNIPQVEASTLQPEEANNIDMLKKRLNAYHDGGNYDADIKHVFENATTYVASRAGEFRQGAEPRPAVVLDIDETSLSNWPNIKANDFGFISGGPCFEEPHLSCGFNEWILKASAPRIQPALDFYKTAIKNNVAVFFITGRRKSQRQATLSNLDSAGFEGFAGLMTRPDDDHADSIVEFKSGQREAIEKNRGYKIIATIGDQQSDLQGGAAECKFKVPNPFYFIP